MGVLVGTSDVLVGAIGVSVGGLGVSVGPETGVFVGPADVEVGGGPGGSSSLVPVPPPLLAQGVRDGVGVEVASVTSVGGTIASGSSNSPIASTVAATAVSTAPGSSESPSASAFAVDRASIVACS